MASAIIRDPGHQIGPYRVRLRTDGAFVLVHEGLLHDGSISAICTSEKAAIEEANRLVKLGSPLVAPLRAVPARKTTDGGVGRHANETHARSRSNTRGR